MQFHSFTLNKGNKNYLIQSKIQVWHVSFHHRHLDIQGNEMKKEKCGYKKTKIIYSFLINNKMISQQNNHVPILMTLLDFYDGPNNLN